MRQASSPGGDDIADGLSEALGLEIDRSTAAAAIEDGPTGEEERGGTTARWQSMRSRHVEAQRQRGAMSRSSPRGSNQPYGGSDGLWGRSRSRDRLRTNNGAISRRPRRRIPPSSPITLLMEEIVHVLLSRDAVSCDGATSLACQSLAH